MTNRILIGFLVFVWLVAVCCLSFCNVGVSSKLMKSNREVRMKGVS